MSSFPPALSAVDWTELNKLLAAALELELRSRTAWLQTLPAQYQHLRGVLLELLLKADELEQPEDARPATFVARAAAVALVSMRRDRAGDLIGHWRLVRLIAEGGMGFLRHNNKVMGFSHDPSTLRIVHLAGSL